MRIPGWKPRPRSQVGSLGHNSGLDAIGGLGPSDGGGVGLDVVGLDAGRGQSHRGHHALRHHAWWRAGGGVGAAAVVCGDAGSDAEVAHSQVVALPLFDTADDSAAAAEAKEAGGQGKVHECTHRLLTPPRNFATRRDP